MKTGFEIVVEETAVFFFIYASETMQEIYARM